jgi:hypothetical protein
MAAVHLSNNARKYKTRKIFEELAAHSSLSRTFSWCITWCRFLSLNVGICTCLFITNTSNVPMWPIGSSSHSNRGTLNESFCSNMNVFSMCISLRCTISFWISSHQLLQKLWGYGLRTLWIFTHAGNRHIVHLSAPDMYLFQGFCCLATILEKRSKVYKYLFVTIFSIFPVFCFSVTVNKKTKNAL